MSLSQDPKRSYWNEDERAVNVIQTKTIDSRPNVRPLTCETVSLAKVHYLESENIFLKIIRWSDYYFFIISLAHL